MATAETNDAKSTDAAQTKDVEAQSTEMSDGPLKREPDTRIVDWDGPDDPQNPKKYVASYSGSCTP